jgi:hypothetical protein
MDEAHKCTILKSVGKIANSDISEDEEALMAKSFGTSPILLIRDRG